MSKNGKRPDPGKRPETETEQIFKELTRQYSFKTRRQRFDSNAFYHPPETETDGLPLTTDHLPNDVTTITDSEV